MKQSKMRVWGLILAVAAGLILTGHVRAEEQQDDNDDEAGWFIPKDTVLKNVYVGVGAGMTMTSDFPDSNQDGSVTSVSTDETKATGKIYAGYQFTDYIAAEAYYHDFDDTEFSGVSSGGPSWSAGNVSAINELDGWGLKGVGSVPVTDRFSLLVSAGIFWWESTEIYNENGTITTEEQTGSDGTFGAGFEYDIGKKDRVVIRGEVEHHVTDESSYDDNTATLGVKYEFP